MLKRVVVVGGGAAGMLAAGTAAGRGLQVTVVEHSQRTCKKILVTGIEASVFVSKNFPFWW